MAARRVEVGPFWPAPIRSRFASVLVGFRPGSGFRFMDSNLSQLGVGSGFEKLRLETRLGKPRVWVDSVNSAESIIGLKTFLQNLEKKREKDEPSSSSYPTWIEVKLDYLGPKIWP